MSSWSEFNMPCIGGVETRSCLDKDGMLWSHLNVGLISLGHRLLFWISDVN